MMGKIARLCAVLLLPLLASAQNNGKAKQDDDFKLSVDVELVQLPVSVLDKDGKVVDNLTKDNFQIFENSVQQNISLFKHEDIPLSMGLVIDNSGSMRSKRERVNTAALTFVRDRKSTRLNSSHRT